LIFTEDVYLKVWEVAKCRGSSIQFPIDAAGLTYKFLFNQALHCLGSLTCVADGPGRRALRSANTDRHLLVPSVRLSSVGGRTFLVTAPRTWNYLPNIVRSAQSLHSFRRYIKTYLFQWSFPDIIV